jgi:1,4-dihydroxy-2-naphthoyl-CoA hydrolase
MTSTFDPPRPPDLQDASAFLTVVGLRFSEVSARSVTGSLELGPQHHTPWGLVHGGVYTSAVESAASVGATAAVADRGQIAVGVHNSTDFLRSARTATATVHATPVYQGRVQQLWDVTVSDQAGNQLARGSLRLQNIDAPR